MLKYKCLLCGIEWGDPEASDLDISHGYCPLCVRQCYTEKIRRAQLKSGYSDCFNRGHNNCSEEHCWFRLACLDHLVDDWKDKIVGNNGKLTMAC